MCSIMLDDPLMSHSAVCGGGESREVSECQVDSFNNICTDFLYNITPWSKIVK